MNFTKLAKYFTWKLPNSEKINISDFVNILGNIWIDSKDLKDFENKFWSISKDYIDLFEKIQWKWDWNIYAILDYFELPKSFVEEVDYTDYVIDESKQSIVGVDKILYDLKLIEDFLSKAKEDEFARYLMIPILEEMWFSNISFYWKVKEKDYWLDMYPITYETPFWDLQYIGIQFKKTNIWHWSTNTEWKNLKSELDDAFSHNWEHISLNWSDIKLDWIITITSWKKSSLKLNKDLSEKYKSSYVRIYDKEDIIKWCQKYKLPVNLETNISEISQRTNPKKKSTKKTNNNL